MSNMKNYLEKHIDEISDAELLEAGYSLSEIKMFRESFSKTQ